MEKTRKQKFRSITSMTFVFVIVLLVVVWAENLLVTKYINDYAEKNVITTSEASLEIVMAQIDNAIVNLNDTVLTFTTANEDFLWLSRNDKNAKNSSEYYLHMAGLIEDMDKQIASATYEQGWFAYFPGCDQKLFRIYNEDIYVFLEQMINEQSMNFYKGIRFLKYDGVPYVFSLYQNNSGWCGSWVSLRKIFNAEVYQDQSDRVFLIEQNIDNEGWTKLNGNRAYQTVVKSSMIDLSVSEIRQMDLFTGASIIRFFVIFSMTIAIVSAIFVLWMYCNMIRPLKKLQTAIERVEEGNLNYRIESSGRSNDIDLLNIEFNKMLEQVKNLKMDVYEMKLRNQKAEMRYLTQQVRPHFILNALNIIYSYQEKDFIQIKRMVMMLTKYFRYIVNVRSDYVPLKMEFDQIRNYLEIQKVRYPYQFDFELLCDKKLDRVGIPPVIIQSFVENSIKYAISTKACLLVSVRAEYLDEEMYRLTIYDTGQGYDDNILDSIQAVLNGENKNIGGIGIRNSIDRMRILYGDRVNIQIFNRDEGGACAKIDLPCIWIDNENV